MVRITRHIEIVTSTVRGLSSMGLKSCAAVQAVLLKHYTSVQVTMVNDLADLQALVARRPDAVFLGMKFIPVHPGLGMHDPDKIWISKYLEDHEIIHTGSDHLAHELEFNKQLAKQRVARAGLRTARFHVAVQDEPLQDLALRYPLFIKPTNRGGGLGIDRASVAHTFTQVQSKVMSLANSLHADSLIEEYLPGREFSVGILKDAYADSYNVMPIELVAPLDSSGERFLSAQVKTEDTERNLEVTDAGLKAKLSSLAIDVFHALGARDYGRIDIRLDAGGIPHFLEANLLPSLIEGYGNFPKTCLLNTGLAYEPMILRILQLAMSRNSFSEESIVEDPIQPITYDSALEPV